MATADVDKSLPRAEGRRQRRRELTRARLIDAARTLAAAHTAESIGITDITEAADVGTGTFYNYFSSRDEILEAVAEESMETVGAALDRVMTELGDPAEVFAGSLRHLVRHALTDPVWGWFIVRMGASHPKLLEILGPRARRDLHRGLEAGRFEIQDLDLAVTCTFGSLISAIRLALSDPAVPDRDQQFAVSMLCMVGVPPADARTVAARPLPEV
ncbi:TetR/AcrR family transcriptional regulator [Corynebacterium pacaense]|uniref:TetR/AcrR family transcriptional regulator n=1 Tax=Corynebacterium pacaense TaxID=1816684 RepID=UPI0009B9E066|nr:TetR/AcrR family transcriptional regulator [Corynebacterium pacaense]